MKMTLLLVAHMNIDATVVFWLKLDSKILFPLPNSLSSQTNQVYTKFLSAFEFFTKDNSARSGGSDRSESVLSLFAFTAMKALLLCVKAKFNHFKWPLPGNFYL